MTADRFARETAAQAHRRATQAEKHALQAERVALELRKLIPARPTQFIGHCSLCGAPTKKDARYCSAHAWAA